MDTEICCVFFLGKNINEEAARRIKEGIDECELWGDLDTQALLMVEGAVLNSKRGRKEDSLMLVKVPIQIFVRWSQNFQQIFQTF